MKNTEQTMLDECAERCHECHDVCLDTIVHCLSLGGMHASRDHQVMLAGCARICAVSHFFLRLHSPQHVHTCRACAEICRACAADCRQMSESDQLMRRCADVCGRCAESCDAMSKAAA
ncbi:MAG: hypothetical protein L6Q35_13745 [Phycisphaerales bacterium]|nr:hypothetical protein [Phycisphaerales bacterium]